MQCHSECGACCVVISISSPIPGMPQGKKAGEPCIHLTKDKKCAIYTHPQRPQVCKGFTAEVSFCGRNASEAYRILSRLEQAIPSV